MEARRRLAGGAGFICLELCRLFRPTLVGLGEGGKKTMIFLRLLPGALARGDRSQINTEGPRLSFQKVKSGSKAASVCLQQPETGLQESCALLPPR